MRATKKALSMLLAVIMLFSITAVHAQAKTFKASSVTAKQIVLQLKKTGLVKKAYKPNSKEIMDLETPNAYQSKYNYMDKKYKEVYCTVEVFSDAYDAAMRQAYINTLSVLYGTFDQEEDIPLQAYRYKNVVLRVGSKMPLNRVLKYYNALKKML